MSPRNGNCEIAVFLCPWLLPLTGSIHGPCRDSSEMKLLRPSSSCDSIGTTKRREPMLVHHLRYHVKILYERFVAEDNTTSGPDVDTASLRGKSDTNPCRQVPPAWPTLSVPSLNVQRPEASRIYPLVGSHIALCRWQWIGYGKAGLRQMWSWWDFRSIPNNIHFASAAWSWFSIPSD